MTVSFERFTNLIKMKKYIKETCVIVCAGAAIITMGCGAEGDGEASSADAEEAKKLEADDAANTDEPDSAAIDGDDAPAE